MAFYMYINGFVLNNLVLFEVPVLRNVMHMI
jgi:hypothetical protein